MLRRLFLLAALGLGLAACVTASNSLAPDQIPTLRLERVTVGFAPNARIWWGDGERAYAASKGLPVHEAEELGKTPEGQAYVRGLVEAKLRDEMTRQLAGNLNGTRPVRIEVTVKELNIASTIQKILVGGSYALRADVNLVDAKSGALLLAFSDQSAALGANGGLLGVLVDKALLAEPIDLIVKSYTSQYRNWLLRN
ncbi:hypothetical protein [Microvirga puerhi]|uniref:DUF3313 domain-containing protein n=1 Tax=Microvirga puerhi TaxID=2876078 RepID=A0ABS7VKP6_9HYPH|nr:hypothetical protein [Microvirga puerhi]MBZ6075518.1 hypothetical protein [Microvirga puerhi]